MAGTQAEIDALLAEAEAQTKGHESTTAVAAAPVPVPDDLPVDLADDPAVPPNVQRILRLGVPLIVVLAERKMPVREILHISIGSIIEFAKPFDEELELLVNNRSIAFGQAVKVGENFGLRITRVADVKARIDALRPQTS